MNTKTDQISSGLVAHIAAFKEALNGTKGDLDAWLECNDESEVRQAIFGVISDAEAIINDLQTLVIAENQRKQQLEEQVAKQSATLELAYSALLVEAYIYRAYDPEDGEPESISEALAAIDALGDMK